MDSITIGIRESRKELENFLDSDKHYILGFVQTAKYYKYVIYPFQYIKNHLMDGTGAEIIKHAYWIDKGDIVTIYK